MARLSCKDNQTALLAFGFDWSQSIPKVVYIPLIMVFVTSFICIYLSEMLNTPTGSVLNTHTAGGVLRPRRHHRRVFATHGPDGHKTNKSMLAYARAILEVIGEP